MTRRLLVAFGRLIDAIGRRTFPIADETCDFAIWSAQIDGGHAENAPDYTPTEG